MPARRDVFTTIRSEGALLPPDFLQRIAEGDKNISGLDPESYHLQEREKLGEAITRSWNRLLGFWAAFQGGSAGLKEGDPATGLTRDKWLVPLFQELGYGRLPAGKGFEIEGKSYPISHARRRGSSPARGQAAAVRPGADDLRRGARADGAELWGPPAPGPAGSYRLAVTWLGGSWSSGELVVGEEPVAVVADARFEP